MMAWSEPGRPRRRAARVPRRMDRRGEGAGWGFGGMPMDEALVVDRSDDAKLFERSSSAEGRYMELRNSHAEKLAKLLVVSVINVIN